MINLVIIIFTTVVCLQIKLVDKLCCIRFYYGLALLLDHYKLCHAFYLLYFGIVQIVVQ